MATTTVYATLQDPQGRSVAGRAVTVRLVSATRLIRGQNTSLSITARTVTDTQGRYSLPLIPNADIDDLGSYYLVREWEIGERAIIVPPPSDPRVEPDGRVPLDEIVVDDSTLLPEPAHRTPVYLMRVERGVADGVASLDATGKVPAAQLPASSGTVPPTRVLTAGVGLSGGGTLESDRTFDVEFGTAAGSVAQGNDPRFSDARTPIAHGHPAEQITGLAPVATTGAYADLTGRPAIPASYADLSGIVPAAAIPAIAITDYLGDVANQAAMLALAGQRGDWCTRTDTGTNWQITGDDPTQLASWRELSYPASPVTSVFGRVGAVTATKADVGLSDVDNTADLDKPVSTATGTALDGKQARVRRVRAWVTSGAALGDPLPNTGGLWTPYAPTGEIAITAQPGDYLDLAIGALIIPETTVYFDVAVKVGSSLVHFTSTNSSSPAAEGDPARYPDPGSFGSLGSFADLDVEAGHIDTDGKVHFVLAVMSSTGGGKIYYSTAFPFRWRVINAPGAAA